MGKKIVAHGRATAGTDRANFLEKGVVCVLVDWHGCATTGTGRAKFLVLLGKFFFAFSLQIWTNTYKTN